ncbi:MAG: hypothetical protein METHAR1v1_310008 [Methanothrix sp.]|nr:MAG: hypothetical protein METHAR1v1_310008 [Methanothrix sp.]
MPVSAGAKAPVVSWIYADSTNLAGLINLEQRGCGIPKLAVGSPSHDICVTRPPLVAEAAV